MKMQMKYNSDPKFKALADQVNGSSSQLAGELGNGDGYTFEDNNGALERAGKQW
jgi:hypothetical protein